MWPVQNALVVSRWFSNLWSFSLQNRHVIFQRMRMGNPAVGKIQVCLQEALRRDEAREIAMQNPGPRKPLLYGIEAGELVFSDEPLVSVQLVDNLSLVKACAYCMRPVGTVASQLRHAAGLDGGSNCANQLPISAADAQLSEEIPCPCGEAKQNGCTNTYCCRDCADAHVNAGHALLCPMAMDVDANLVEAQISGDTGDATQHDDLASAGAPEPPAHLLFARGSL